MLLDASPLAIDAAHQRLMAGPAEAIDIDAVCLKPLVVRDLARTIRQVFAQRTA